MNPISSKTTIVTVCFISLSHVNQSFLTVYPKRLVMGYGLLFGGTSAIAVEVLARNHMSISDVSISIAPATVAGM